MKFHLPFVLLILFITKNLIAAPSFGKQYQFQQPDGSSVPVMVWGDEYFQHVESLDGIPLARNKQGWICIAKLNADSSAYIATSQIYKPTTNYQAAPKQSDHPKYQQETRTHNKAPFVAKKHRDVVIQRNQQKINPSVSYQPAPSTTTTVQTPSHFSPAPPEPDARLFRNGTIRALTILVDFSDQPATMPKAELDSLYNQIGYTKYGNNGSVRDYFRDVSRNKIDLQWDFVGYVRAPKPKWYYDNPTMTTPYEHTWEFINDVVRIADAQYDFSTLTQNPYNNNSVLSLTIMYAGEPTAGWTMGLWPHAGYLGITLDNQWIQGYSCVNIGNMSLEIGTIAHEAGHSIGNYADFYDMDGGGAGTGTYDLMGTGGGGNPPLLGPHNLIQSGWANVIDISYLDNDSTIRITENTNTVLRYINPNADEQFYIEMRHNTLRPSPAEGIVIWHADATYGVNNNRENMTPTEHYWMSVEQADGQNHIEKGLNWGDAYDSWFNGQNASFNVNSIPNSRWWDGSDSKLSLSEISPLGTQMSLKVGARPGSFLPATKLDNAQNGIQVHYLEGDFSSVYSIPWDQASIVSTLLQPDLSLAQRTDGFAMRFQGYILVPHKGFYTFYIKSDDGSSVTIDGMNLLNHDGFHDSFQEISNTIGLDSGLHSIVINYFEYSGGESLELSWSSNQGLSKSIIPASAYFLQASNHSECEIFTENETKRIHCPEGQVIDSILFASYGTPLGICGFYSLGTCYANAVQTWIQSQCSQQTHCELTASNMVFGDPCPGIQKKMAVQYTCKDAIPVILTIPNSHLSYQKQHLPHWFDILGRVPTFPKGNNP